MTRSDRFPTRAFSLVELILVMVLLATIMAFAAPSLSRTLGQRQLEQEAVRLLALTEYARSEAISQGVPMAVTIDWRAKRISVSPCRGFEAPAGRDRIVQLDDAITMEATQPASAKADAATVEFAPDGTLRIGSVESVQLTDRTNSTVSVARTKDGWGYEIVKEQP